MVTPLVSGNGHRPARAKRRRVSRRAGFRLLGAGVLALLVAALVTGYLRDRGWVRIGSLDSLRQAKVVYVSNLHLFVVANGRRPVALSERGTAPGYRVLFCTSSGYFQDRAGSIFDPFGMYVGGPATRGLTRIAIRVKGQDVDVKPGDRKPGPEVGTPGVQLPVGPACDPNGPEGPAGFLRSAAG